MATIEKILRMSATERKAAFGVSALSQHDGKPIGIETVIIDGTPFTDYGAFSFLWEKSYVKSPVRSGDGSIGNLNSYATFITPHLKIDFSLMSIDSYRDLMNLIYDKNEFTVTCYDVVNNKMTTNRMYFSTEEMPKLWTIARAINGEEWVELLGVQEYTVEMVGTNASLEMVNIIYYDENGKILYSQEATKGEDVVIQYDYVPTNGRFDGEWEKDGSSTAIVRNGDAIKANTYSDSVGDIKLKAKVVPTDEYTLSIVYGNGNPLYNRQTGEVINSVKIKKGQTIATAFANAGITLPNGVSLAFPENGTGSVSKVYEDIPYTPYEFDGWYWTSEKATTTRVYGSTEFDKTANATIYQIYSPKPFSVTYEDNSDVVSFDPISVPYSSAVPLPRPRVEGYTLVGWYTDNETFEKPFSGTMPPKKLTLYAKWVKNE